MIGKSLNERHGVRRALPAETAVSVLNDVLPVQAPYIVRVRANDAAMVACLIVKADDASVRMCRSFGLEMKPGGTGVIGLLGPDAARTFAELPDHQRVWLATPCGPRETKVLLIAHGGVALLSLETHDGETTVRAVPFGSS